MAKTFDARAYSLRHAHSVFCLTAAGFSRILSAHMKKRLRKKYRVGEFRELCFEFSIEYKGDVNAPECMKFLEALIEDCIEANDLDCEGSINIDGCNIVARATDPTKTSQAQLEAVKSWLEAREDVTVLSFSELEDYWYAKA